MHLQQAQGIKEFPRYPVARVAQILLIEDCKSDVYLMRALLENISVGCFYEITDVPRLVDAFYKIDKQKFDLVMLDLNLLDIDGVASVAALRAQMQNIPIVVYSGMDDDKIKTKALLCGATQYLVKGKENGSSIKHLIEDSIA